MSRRRAARRDRRAAGPAPAQGAQGARGAQPSPPSSGVGKPTQAELLVTLAQEAGIELFHAPDGETGYASIPVDDHRETWPIRSTGCGRWLRRLYYQAIAKPLSTQPVEDARQVLESQAQYDGATREVFVRVGHAGDAVFLDLGNQRWEVVEVTASGWRVRDTSPVAFRRPRGMLPLPLPVWGGRLDELRGFLNVGSDDNWRLTVAWLVGALNPVGPYPVLPIHGEQGSGKTTAQRVLRNLVDPNTASLRAEPREPRDLAIAATNGWVVAFDNISRLPVWLSDALCRLATGGGFATRELYTDRDEVIFNAKRPVLLNGIEEIVTRGDLLDRSLIVYLPRIADDHRRPEREFWAAVSEAHPRMLGALLDAVSCALRRQDHVHLDQRPRMADFAIWVTAAEPALGWEEKSFVTTYITNRGEGAMLELEASPVAVALRAMMEARVQAQLDPWRGTATELLAALGQHAGEAVTRARDWPGSPQALGGLLRRLAPNLRTVGIEIQVDGEGHGRHRRKLFEIRPGNPAHPGHPEPPEPEPQGAQGAQDFPPSSAPPPADPFINPDTLMPDD